MQKTGRLWEIDSARGIAVVLMVVSNFVTDAVYFGIYSAGAYSVFWTALARIVVSMFILIAGMSLALSYSKVRDRKPGEMRKKYFLRGAKIFGLGMAITAVTWLFIGEDFVLFGILHLIGASVILGHFIAGRKSLGLFLGILFIAAGLYLQSFAFDFPWLAWLGFRPEGFYSVDYVPLLPWFGLFLIGMFLGGVLYPEGRRKFRIRDLSGSRAAIPLQFLGKNSLRIYMMHQPVLILALWLLFPFPHQFPV